MGRCPKQQWWLTGVTAFSPGWESSSTAWDAACPGSVELGRWALTRVRWAPDTILLIISWKGEKYGSRKED